MGEVTYAEFPFKLPPYKHQLDCWRICRDRELYALFCDMGTGKSKILLDNSAYLHMQNKISASVIVAPKGVYLNWIDNEIPTHFSDAIEHDKAYWSASARSDEKKALANLMDLPGKQHRILCMNIEALTNDDCDAARYLRDFIKKFPSLVAVDESTTIKNRQAHRTKVLTKIGKLAKYRRILSGNPIPNGPMDLYSQAEFLDKHLLGFPNFYGFRNRFAVMQDMHLGARSFKKVVGYRDQEVLKQLMRQFSFIIKKKDCLDLPEKIYQTMDVEMSDEQKKAYNSMLEDGIVQLSSGATVTASMVMTQLTRLHQIACGFLPTDHGDVPIEDPPRISALMDLLEQHSTPGKVIIWATYRTNIFQLRDAITAKFGRASVVEFFGDTTQEERRDAKVLFQDPTSPARFFLSNPATAKFGNTLTQGVTVIYYSNDYDLEKRDQSEDRSHRIGQDRSVLYIDLRCRGTVDDRILRCLRQKKKLSDSIVQSNWRWLLGDKVA